MAVGCAKNRPWPAVIVGVQGFSTEQRAQLVDALQDLNKRLGHEIVLLQNTDANSINFPVTIELGTSSDAPETSLAGVATVTSYDCVINISPKVFMPEHPDTFKSVLWHELGHCAGLLHDPTPGQIMYKSSTQFAKYKAPELTHFFQSVVSSAGLNFAVPAATPLPTPAL